MPCLRSFFVVLIAVVACGAAGFFLLAVNQGRSPPVDGERVNLSSGVIVPAVPEETSAAAGSSALATDGRPVVIPSYRNIGAPVEGRGFGRPLGGAGAAGAP